MAELKPCPFCGGTAQFLTTGNESSNSGVGFSYIIRCSNCKCTPIQKEKEMHLWLDNCGQVRITEVSETVRKQAIVEWNTRTMHDNAQKTHECDLKE